MAFTWNLSLPAASPRQTLRALSVLFAAGLHDNDNSRRREPQRQEGPGGKRAIKPEMAGWEWDGAINRTKLWALDCPCVEITVAHQFCVLETLNPWVLRPQGWAFQNML